MDQPHPRPTDAGRHHARDESRPVAGLLTAQQWHAASLRPRGRRRAPQFERPETRLGCPTEDRRVV